MTHIEKSDGSFYCGTRDDLRKTDPTGWSVTLAIMFWGQDALTFRRQLDARADVADCPACRMAYVMKS